MLPIKLFTLMITCSLHTLIVTLPKRIMHTNLCRRHVDFHAVWLSSVNNIQARQRTIRKWLRHQRKINVTIRDVALKTDQLVRTNFANN